MSLQIRDDDVMVFRERLSGPQYVGVALGVVAVVLMMLQARDHGS